MSNRLRASSNQRGFTNDAFATLNDFVFVIDRLLLIFNFDYIFSRFVPQMPSPALAPRRYL